MEEMDDAELLRYSRQIMLPQLDVAGQQKLRDARVLIVGLGGLGSPVAMYLAAAGVGHLVGTDFDRVDLSNLQRQIVHGTGDIGRPKIASAHDRLRALNPLVTFTGIGERLEGEALLREVAAAQVVVDATDNFATRFALNEACVRSETPLVSGAVIRFEGQVSVFLPGRPDSPCYRCLYRDEAELAETCSQTGVLAPVAGIIGSVQATEVLKILTGVGSPLVGRLWLLDAMSMESRTVKLRKDPSCPVCATRATRSASP